MQTLKIAFRVGYAACCMGAKEGGIELLTGVAPSSQRVASLFSVINEKVQRSSLITVVFEGLFNFLKDFSNFGLSHFSNV
jgi:hypothetical protein